MATFLSSANESTVNRLIEDARDAFSSKEWTLESMVIGQLSVRLSWVKLELTNLYQLERARTTIASQIIQYLQDMSVLNSKTDMKTSIINNKKERRLYRFLKTTMDVNERREKNSLPSREPGVLPSKRSNGDVSGRGTKFNSTVKSFLTDYSSQPFRLVDLSEDELKTYISTRKDFMSESNESKILKGMRFNDYVSTYRNLVGERIYHPVKLDKRGRLIGTTTQALMNTYGDHFETSTWELADAEVINEDGYNALVFAAVTIVDGRTSKKKAQSVFAKEKFRIYQSLDSMGLYEQRLRQALNDYNTKTPSHFLLGFDCTNGGLQHMGVSFHDKLMMKMGNLSSLATPQDSHKGLRDHIHDTLGYDLDRKRVKKLNTEFLHGSSYKSVADHLSAIIIEDLDVEVEISEEQMRSIFSGLLGATADNIETIASLGSMLYDEQNLSLRWSMPDGFIAQSTSYMKGSIVKCFVEDSSSKKGYRQLKVARDMPSNYLNGEVIDVERTRGLFANITHSIDSYTLRELKRRTNFVMMTKHDNFFTHPNNSNKTSEVYLEIMTENFDKKLYENALLDIVNNHSNYDGGIPTLLYGVGSKSEISKATCHLMA
jgi:hypothetical protein